MTGFFTKISDLKNLTDAVNMISLFADIDLGIKFQEISINSVF